MLFDADWEIIEQNLENFCDFLAKFSTLGLDFQFIFKIFQLFFFKF